MGTDNSGAPRREDSAQGIHGNGIDWDWTSAIPVKLTL
jgi:hypothetical protein